MALTRTDGPLSADAPATVNYRIDGPAHKLLMHPVPAPCARRVRRPHRAGHPPRRARARDGAAAPAVRARGGHRRSRCSSRSDHTTHCPFKGDATYRTLRVGDRVVENALWAYPDPLPSAKWLAGYASLYWHAADAWYDEDEQVFAPPHRPLHAGRHPADQPARAGARRGHSRRRVAPPAGAERDRPARRAGTSSPDDVRMPLEPTATAHPLPVQGRGAATGPSGCPDGRELTDAAWGYPEPLPESSRIAGPAELPARRADGAGRRRAGLTRRQLDSGSSSSDQQRLEGGQRGGDQLRAARRRVGRGGGPPGRCGGCGPRRAAAAPYSDSTIRTPRASCGSGVRITRPCSSSAASTRLIVGAVTASRRASSDSRSGPCCSTVTSADSCSGGIDSRPSMRMRRCSLPHREAQPGRELGLPRSGGPPSRCRGRPTPGGLPLVRPVWRHRHVVRQVHAGPYRGARGIDVRPSAAGSR